MIGRRILVVDDDRDLAESLADILSARGYEVDVAFNGREAVAKFSAADFDLAFMDVQMPVMNGVEALLEIRRIRPGARVVMMTGNAMHQLVDEATDNGALGLLRKPFDVPEALRIIGGSMTRGMVLLADDDPEFARSLSAVLTGQGYRTMVAGTGAETVAKVRAGGVDVLVLDLRIPAADGLAVYQSLRADGAAPPTIVVTGYAEEERSSIEALRGLSVADCLEKPVDPAILLRAIAAIEAQAKAVS